MMLLYMFGIVCGMLYALILKHTRFKGEPVPFVMELPNYRLPSARSVRPADLGKRQGFCAEGLYDHFCGDGHHLVLADL